MIGQIDVPEEKKRHPRWTLHHNRGVPHILPDSLELVSFAPFPSCVFFPPAHLLVLLGNKTRQEALIGDAFLSCGCLSYYGPFTGSYRDELVSSWMERVKTEGIPCGSDGGKGGGGGNNDFSLIDTLGDPVEIRGWQNYALPTDKVMSNLSYRIGKNACFSAIFSF